MSDPETTLSWRSSFCAVSLEMCHIGNRRQLVESSTFDCTVGRAKRILLSLAGLSRSCFHSTWLQLSTCVKKQSIQCFYKKSVQGQIIVLANYSLPSLTSCFDAIWIQPMENSVSTVTFCKDHLNQVPSFLFCLANFASLKRSSNSTFSGKRLLTTLLPLVELIHIPSLLCASQVLCAHLCPHICHLVESYLHLWGVPEGQRSFTCTSA